MNITLLGQPQSTNHIYKSACISGRASVYMSAAGRVLKESYQWEVRRQRSPSSKPLSIEIRLDHGDKRARDVDNYCKLLLDALTGIVWEDYKQIQRMTVAKAYDKQNPRIEINVLELEPATA